MSKSERTAHLQCQPGVRSAYKFEACGVVLQRAVFKEPGVYWLFFQRHMNGHEVCGFYRSNFELRGQQHGHAPGSQVCRRR